MSGSDTAGISSRITGPHSAVDAEQEQPRLSGGLVIFDLDRTLTTGSSLVPLGRAVVREGLVAPRSLGRHAIEAAVYAVRGERNGVAGRLRDDLLSLAAGQWHAPLAAIAAQVGRELVSDMHPTARWLVDRHLAAGDFCVIASASVHELVESVAAALGVHRGVGTRPEVVGGRLTGSLAGPLCHGPHKLAALREELGEVDLCDAVAYSDSLSDLPLLSAVGDPVAVNPDRGLRREACRRGWPVMHFR